MADDWIKMRTDLYRDPKVCVLADLLLDGQGDLARYVSQNMQRDMTVTRNVMRNAIVGTLVTVWGVARRRGKRNGDDLRIDGASVSVVDDLADLPGLGEAMESVGWLEQDADGLVFPNFFEEYNVEKDKAKTKAAERQKRYRAKKKSEQDTPSAGSVGSNVTVTSRNAPREEKRREEENKEPPIPQGENGASDEEQPQTPPYSIDFEAWWSNYPRQRRSKKQQAYRKWKTVTKTVDAEMLIARVRDYAKSPQGQSEYAVLPTVWLNAGMWEDEPEAWQRKSDARTSQDELFHSIPKVG